MGETPSAAYAARIRQSGGARSPGRSVHELATLAFVAVLFGFSVVLTSCEQAAPKAKKKKDADPSVAEAIDSLLPPSGAFGRRKSDPLGASRIRRRRRGQGPHHRSRRPRSIWHQGAQAAEVHPVECATAPKNTGTAGEPVEHVLKSPSIFPRPGSRPPTPKPQVVTLTYIGGAGNQWIQEVGFMEDGRIYAKSGGDTFTVYYSADGTKKLEMTGDISKPCTGNRGPNLKTWGGGADRASCPTFEGQAGDRLHSYGVTKAQTVLDLHRPTTGSGGAGPWNEHSEQGHGRGGPRRQRPLHARRSLPGDGARRCRQHERRPRTHGSRRTPIRRWSRRRDPARPAPARCNMVGNGKTGAAVVGTFVKGKSPAETATVERVYVGLPWSGNNVPDTLKLGGTGGFCILNNNLTTCLFRARWGPTTSIRLR